MTTYVAQVLFVLLLAVAGWLLARRIRFIRAAIGLGKPEQRTDQRAARWRNMLLVAFGQRKMFKKPIPALLHLFVYVGFLLINIEVLEIIIDGLAGTHRIFAPYLGHAYTWLLNFFELLAVLVMVACVIFLIRRNIIKVPRFHKPEMRHWPYLDANLILIFEILLVLAILNMNAADQLLQARGVAHYTPTGKLLFSSFFMPPLQGLSTPVLIALERFFWWFHIAGILAFAVYVTYSKHLHIFMAFPNTWYADLQPKGKMTNMEVVTNEVKMMLGLQPAQEAAPPPEEIGRFGAKDVTDLSWKSLMDAFTCTECGRCTAECPANLTGKKLSPRKIMMDTRDRAEELARLRLTDNSTDDQHTLLDNFISREELHACTTCNACVEACPVLINPLRIILDLRRYLVMEESSAPAEWNAMFQNIETSFNPWKFAPTDRFKWADEMKSNS